MTLTGVRGDTLVYELTIRDSVTSLPIDISNVDLVMTVKYDWPNPDVSAVYQISTAEGSIAITDGPNGKARIKVGPMKTSGVIINSNLAFINLVFDVQMTRDGDVSTILRGNLKLFADATLI